MHFDDDGSGRLTLRDGATTLLDYVYEPTDAALESPRPYALLRTRSDQEVTAYRPGDHIWHKGLSLALPYIGGDNFWGGPTYVHGEGYVQRDNNGAQHHESFHESSLSADVLRVVERLTWRTAQGTNVIDEHRTITARPVGTDAWALTWHSALRNLGEAFAIGSPTSHGREDAGYAGIFWRGPATFTGGEILSPDGAVGDDARGHPAEWLAFVSPDRSAGVLMAGGDEGAPWFARSADYAGLCPAPFFFDERRVDGGAETSLSAVLVVGGADVARHADVVPGLLVEVRHSSAPAPTRLIQEDA